MYEEIEHLYLLYYRELYGYLRKIGANESIADDIIQTSFLEALKNLEGYRGKSSLKTWLFAIAKNQTYQYYRKHKEEFPLEVDFTAKVDDLTDKLMVDEIFEFIDDLNPPLNDIMKLRLLHGLPFKVIGEKTGRTENYCRVNYYRIKERIRKEFVHEEL